MQHNKDHWATAEAHLAAIVTSSSDGIVSKDLNGNVQSWNQAAETLLGWTEAEMLGQSMRRIIPAELQDEETEILRRIGIGERVPRFQTTRLSKAGVLIPVAITVSPVRDENEKVVGASAIISNLRDQLQKERDLQESEKRFRALADNIPQLAWMADKSGWIFWYNRRWYEFTGTMLEEMEGWGWQSVHHPEHVEGVRERFTTAIRQGKPWEDTFPLRGAHGDYRWFLSRAMPVKNDDGDIELWFGTNTDVTRQREDEEQIKVLMGEVNHRAKNMLSVVQSIIHRTSRGANADFVSALEKRIAALAKNQDLLIKRGWSGATVDDIVKFQLEFVEDLYGDRLRIDDGNVRFQLRPNAAEALGLAIHELATNALKYGAWSNDEGTVEIAWRIDENSSPPSLVVDWIETGGPTVYPPSETGFGTILITRNVKSAMGADVALEYAPSGLHWRITGPIERVGQATS